VELEVIGVGGGGDDVVVIVLICDRPRLVLQDQAGDLIAGRGSVRLGVPGYVL